MIDLLSSIFSLEFVAMWIRVATPIIFTSLGAVICEKSGVVNLGLEGIMLSAGLMGVIGSAYSNSLFIGMLSGILMGLILSALFGFFHLYLKANPVLCGTAINLFSSGFTVFVMEQLTGEKGTTSSLLSKTFPVLNIPLIDKIPVIGRLLSGHNVLSYIAILMVFVVYVFLNKTPLGLRIRAVGENENAIKSVGANVNKLRFISIMLCGVLASFGGMYLSMGYLDMFVKNMVAGRGFIALAANAMGRCTPLGALLSSLLFAFFDGLSNIMQILRIPSEFVQMLPYLATILGLVIYAINLNHIKTKKIKGVANANIRENI
ncbi:MAG: ABC transporter permease [Pleomorphochaeta sp.]|jgi:simple sugar transport system permease protein